MLVLSVHRVTVVPVASEYCCPTRFLVICDEVLDLILSRHRASTEDSKFINAGLLPTHVWPYSTRIC